MSNYKPYELEISPRSIILFLKKIRIPVLVGFAIGSILGGLYIFLIQPRYFTYRYQIDMLDVYIGRFDEQKVNNVLFSPRYIDEIVNGIKTAVLNIELGSAEYPNISRKGTLAFLIGSPPIFFFSKGGEAAYMDLNFSRKLSSEELDKIKSIIKSSWDSEVERSKKGSFKMLTELMNYRRLILDFRRRLQLKPIQMKNTRFYDFSTEISLLFDNIYKLRAEKKISAKEELDYIDELKKIEYERFLLPLEKDVVSLRAEQLRWDFLDKEPSISDNSTVFYKKSIAQLLISIFSCSIFAIIFQLIFSKNRNSDN